MRYDAVTKVCPRDLSHHEQLVQPVQNVSPGVFLTGEMTPPHVVCSQQGK